MNPISHLREAVRTLDNVPDSTPVEPTLAYGAPNALAYDANANLVRLSLGWGPSMGRPTMGQLRAWLGLATKAGLAGPWASARGLEAPTLRGALVFASALVSGYHGVRRNGGSAWWGLVWFGLGAALPGVVPLVAVAQGYGACANNCRVSPSERR